MEYYVLLLVAFLLRKIVNQVRSRRHAQALALRGAQRQPDRGLVGLWMAHLAFFVLVPLDLYLRRPPFIPALGITMLGLFAVAFVLRWWSTRLLAANWT